MKKLFKFIAIAVAAFLIFVLGIGIGSGTPNEVVKEVPGPERIIEKKVEVPGPVREVEKKVEVATVPDSCISALFSSDTVIEQYLEIMQLAGEAIEPAPGWNEAAATERLEELFNASNANLVDYMAMRDICRDEALK